MKKYLNTSYKISSILIILLSVISCSQGSSSQSNSSSTQPVAIVEDSAGNVQVNTTAQPIQSIQSKGNLNSTTATITNIPVISTTKRVIGVEGDGQSQIMTTTKAMYYVDDSSYTSIFSLTGDTTLVGGGIFDSNYKYACSNDSIYKFNVTELIEITLDALYGNITNCIPGYAVTATGTLYDYNAKIAFNNWYPGTSQSDSTFLRAIDSRLWLLEKSNWQLYVGNANESASVALNGVQAITYAKGANRLYALQGNDILSTADGSTSWDTTVAPSNFVPGDDVIFGYSNNQITFLDKTQKTLSIANINQDGSLNWGNVTHITSIGGDLGLDWIRDATILSDLKVQFSGDNGTIRTLDPSTNIVDDLAPHVPVAFICTKTSNTDCYTSDGQPSKSIFKATSPNTSIYKVDTGYSAVATQKGLLNVLSLSSRSYGTLTVAQLGFAKKSDTGTWAAINYTELGINAKATSATTSGDEGYDTIVAFDDGSIRGINTTTNQAEVIAMLPSATLSNSSNTHKKPISSLNSKISEPSLSGCSQILLFHVSRHQGGYICLYGQVVLADLFTNTESTIWITLPVSNPLKIGDMINYSWQPGILLIQSHTSSGNVVYYFPNIFLSTEPIILKNPAGVPYTDFNSKYSYTYGTYFWLSSDPSLLYVYVSNNNSIPELYGSYQLNEGESQLSSVNILNVF